MMPYNSLGNVRPILSSGLAKKFVTDLHWKQSLEIALLSKHRGVHLQQDPWTLPNFVTRMQELRKRRISALFWESVLIRAYQKSLLSLYTHKQLPMKQLWLQNEPWYPSLAVVTLATSYKVFQETNCSPNSVQGLTSNTHLVLERKLQNPFSPSPKYEWSQDPAKAIPLLLLQWKPLTKMLPQRA